MGQQIVQDLASAATTALNQAIPALLDNLNPVARIGKGADIFTGLIHGKDSKTDTAHGNNSTQAQPTAAATTPIATATAPAPQPVPKKVQDPAYAEIIKVVTYLTTLNVIVGGKDSDGSIDWDKAHGDATKENSKSNIRFLLAMLNDAKERFAGIATEEEPSTELTDVLNTCIKVIISVSLLRAVMSHRTDRFHPRSTLKWRNHPMHQPCTLPRSRTKSRNGRQISPKSTGQQTRSSRPPRASLGLRLMASPSWPTPLSRPPRLTPGPPKLKPYWSPPRIGW